MDAEKFFEEIENKAVDWRFKKLSESWKEKEEPRGIMEIVDYTIWGKQTWCQKAISNKKDIILKKVLEDVERKNKCIF